MLLDYRNELIRPLIHLLHNRPTQVDRPLCEDSVLMHVSHRFVLCCSTNDSSYVKLDVRKTKVQI